MSTSHLDLVLEITLSLVEFVFGLLHALPTGCCMTMLRWARLVRSRVGKWGNICDLLPSPVMGSVECRIPPLKFPFLLAGSIFARTQYARMNRSDDVAKPLLKKNVKTTNEIMMTCQWNREIWPTQNEGEGSVYHIH
jgi:hypothetical protein